MNYYIFAALLNALILHLTEFPFLLVKNGQILVHIVQSKDNFIFRRLYSA